jgi:hypothetical protein
MHAIAQLQERLASLTDDGIAATADFCLDFLRSNGPTCLLRNLFTILDIRFRSVSSFAALIASLSHAIDTPERLIDCLVDLCFERQNSVTSLSLLFHLTETGLLSIARVCERICSGSFRSTFPVGIWFAPELRAFRPAEFPSLHCDTVAKYRRDSFDRPLICALQRDDVNALQSLIQSDRIDINSEVELTELELIFTFLSRMNCSKFTIIELAAFFAAVKCCKFLLMNQADLECAVRVGVCAIFGGSHEIVRLVSQGKQFSDNCTAAAIRCFRSDIAFWLIDTIQTPVRELGLAAASANNLEFIAYALENGLGVNDPLDMLNVPFVFRSPF